MASKLLLQEREIASDARCVSYLSNPEGAGPSYPWRWGASAHWDTDIMLGHEAPSRWPDNQLIAPGKAAVPARRSWQARGATRRPYPGLARQRLHRRLPLHMHWMLTLMPCQVPCCCISFHHRDFESGVQVNIPFSGGLASEQLQQFRPCQRRRT